MQLLDNLAKQTSSPSHRSIQQAKPIVVKVAGSEGGYLIAALYWNNFPQIVRYDGLSGNLANGQADPKDGIVIIPTYHPFMNRAIPMSKGQYTLHIEAADSPSAIPQFWNLQFDIV